jgi:hypothetical protein
MTKTCTKIIFSKRAYNSIVVESYDKIKTETGGILLGNIIDDIWYVVEVIDPGPNSIFTVSYFEYDTAYVNHLAKAISKLYKIELAVLGLWHRHPGSMDTFSSTDDLTNAEFAKLHPKGAISGLLNIDPNLRLTMYHVSFPLKYTATFFDIGDHLLPDSLLEFKFFEVEQSFFSQENQENSHISQTRRANRKKFMSRISDYFFRKSETTIIINNYLPNESSISKSKDVDEDHLVELYANEEIQLENILKVKYENKVCDHKIVYSVSEYTDGRIIEPPICFSVNLDAANPMFHCNEHDFNFSNGVFSRYIESRLNNSEFIG